VRQQRLLSIELEKRKAVRVQKSGEGQARVFSGPGGSPGGKVHVSKRGEEIWGGGGPSLTQFRGGEWRGDLAGTDILLRLVRSGHGRKTTGDSTSLKGRLRTLFFRRVGSLVPLRGGESPAQQNAPAEGERNEHLLNLEDRDRRRGGSYVYCCIHNGSFNQKGGYG